jgi:hypothetical protein
MIIWGRRLAFKESRATTVPRRLPHGETAFAYLSRDNDLPNSTAPTALAEDGEGFLWGAGATTSERGVAFWRRRRTQQSCVRKKLTLWSHHPPVVVTDVGIGG